MTLAPLVAFVAVSISAQTPDLAPVAAAAREAFLSRDFGRLFEPRQSVRLSLPHHPALPVVRGVAAAATLRALARRTEDSEVTLVRAAMVERRHGYIELARRFRVAGTQQLQRDRILLSAVLDSAGWRITEVLIVEVPETK